MRTRRWLTGMIGASLALAACSGGGSTSQHKTTQSQAAQSGGNPCPPASCAANLNGTSTTTTSTNVANSGSSKALQAWASAHLASLETLNSQAGHLLGGAGDVQQEQLACSQLGSGAQAALSAPRPPDAAIAARLQSALTQLAQLARDCTAAFTGGDRAAASRLVFEANQGTAALTAVIHNLNTPVRSP